MEAFNRLLLVDKFIAKSIIEGYISLLYKIYSDYEAKFLIFYEGSIIDKIKKKLNKKINAHRKYSIPDEIKNHFILFRDTEFQSQYGILSIDFSNCKILYEGPFHDNPSPIKTPEFDDWNKENIYDYSIFKAASKTFHNSAKKNKYFTQNKCDSELLRQLVFDHILEYKSESEIDLLKGIQKCFDPLGTFKLSKSIDVFSLRPPCGLNESSFGWSYKYNNLYLYQLLYLNFQHLFQIYTNKNI